MATWKLLVSALASAGKASAVQKANESMEMLRGMAEGT